MKEPQSLMLNNKIRRMKLFHPQPRKATFKEMFSIKKQILRQITSNMLWNQSDYSTPWGKKTYIYK